MKNEITALPLGQPGLGLEGSGGGERASKDLQVGSSAESPRDNRKGQAGPGQPQGPCRQRRRPKAHVSVEVCMAPVCTFM